MAAGRRMRIRRIFRNTAVSIAGHGVGEACSLFFLVVFARTFGSDVLGEFWYAMAIGALSSLLIVRGTSVILLRESSQRPERMPAYIGAATALQLLLALVLIVAMFALAPMLAEGTRAQRILVTIFVYQVGYTLASVFRTYFNATERMQYNALLETAHKLLILGGGLAALFLLDDPAKVLIVYPVAALFLYLAGYLLLARENCRPRLRLDWRMNAHWMVAAFPVFASGILLMLASRGGIIVLGHVADTATLGLYAAADRIVAAAMLPFVMLTGAVFPIVSKLVSTPRQLVSFVQTCLRLMAVASVPLVSLLFVLREPVVTLIFGESFESSAALLGILALGIGFAAVNTLLGIVLVATDNQWTIFRLTAVKLGILALGIALTVPQWGALGLAASVVASKCAATITLLLVVRNRLGIRIRPAIAAPAAAGAVMVLALAFLAPWGLYAGVAAAILLSTTALLVFRGFEADDLDRLRNLVGR